MDIDVAIPAIADVRRANIPEVRRALNSIFAHAKDQGRCHARAPGFSRARTRPASPVGRGNVLDEEEEAIGVEYVPQDAATPPLKCQTGSYVFQGGSRTRGGSAWQAEIHKSSCSCGFQPDCCQARCHSVPCCRC